MVYQFIILSGENEEFIRELEIKEKQSFIDLHNLIKESCNFKEGEIASFYLCNDSWEKEKEISMFPWDEAQDDSLLMDAALSSLLTEKHQKLVYIFDLFRERGFFIELMDILPEDESIKYPRIIRSEGEAPAQFESIDSNDSFLDMEDDILDEFDDEFSEEDLDDGFSEEYYDEY